MDAMALSLFLVVCLAGGALSSSLFSPCKKSDLACIETAVTNAMPHILNGIPEYDIESSDPLFVDVIEGNLPTLEYTLYNSTIVGLKTCTISNIKAAADVTAIHCELDCKELKIDGQYDLKGTLITLPAEGKGAYTYISGKFILTIDTEIEKVKGSDGKTHAVVKNFKVDSKSLTPATFDFKNLFNGQEDLANALKKFTQEHWQEVTEFVRAPFWSALLKKVFDNWNKYLQNVALEETLLN